MNRNNKFTGFAFNKLVTCNKHFVSNKLGFLHSENIHSFCVITPFNNSSTFVFVIFFNTDNATPVVATCKVPVYRVRWPFCVVQKKIWVALRNISSLFSAISLSCAPPREAIVSRSSSGFEVLHGLLARLYYNWFFLFC